MKTTKSAVILLTLVLLLTAATARSAEKPAKQELSNTRTASCLLKITTSEAVLPLNEFAVDYLIRSSGVAGKAGREVLDISPALASEFITCKEIYSIDADPYGDSGISPGASSRTFSSYKTPTATASRTTRTRRTSAARTPVPTRATRTPTPRPARPATTTRRPPKATETSPSSPEQTIFFRLQIKFSDAISNLMSALVDAKILKGIDKGSITGEDIKPAAEEFMIALIDNLHSALGGAFDEYRTKFNQQLELASNEVARAEVELVQMQLELRNISGSRDLSRYAIIRDISSLRQKLQSAMMQVASNEVLIKATAKRIAEEQDRRKELVENDPIAKEFKSILDMHERRLKETQKLYDSGRASAADIQEIKEKIIRARIELAQRQEEVSNPPGSIEISSLNDEVADLAIKIELSRRQEIPSLEEQLKEAEELLGKADRYELLSLKADIAKQSLEEALLWRARLGRNIRSIQPPDVTVIGAE